MVKEFFWIFPKEVKNLSYGGGVMAATVAAFCWGVSTVMSKGSLVNFPPSLLLVIQLAFSSLFIWAFIFIARLPHPPKVTIMKFALLGLLEPGLAYFLGLWGLLDTSASSATLIQSSEAIMIILISALLYKQSLSGSLMVLGLIAMGGILIVLAKEDVSHTNTLLGAVLIFGGTLAAAFYVALSSAVMGNYSAMVVVAYQQTAALIAAILFLPFNVEDTTIWSLQTVPVSAWGLAFASGIVQYALAFSFYLAALRAIGAGVAAMFLNLVPIFGVLAAIIFLGEQMTMAQMTGATITIVALTILAWKRMPAGAPAH